MVLNGPSLWQFWLLATLLPSQVSNGAAALLECLSWEIFKRMTDDGQDTKVPAVSISGPDWGLDWKVPGY